jgi:hypothetical protein
MIRTFIGGLVGGLILFVMGYIFWATPLGDIAFSRATDAQNAAVQTALAQNLTEKGTGAYKIPDSDTREGAALYARGPVSTVFYNTDGFAPEDKSMILPGLVLALVVGLMIAFALAAVAPGRRFADLARLVILYSLGFTFWEYLATPIFNHFGWKYWIYAFTAESVSLILAGLVVARWFVPREEAASIETAEAAPAD